MPTDPNDTNDQDLDNEQNDAVQETEVEDEALETVDEAGDAGADEGEDEGADETETSVDDQPRRRRGASDTIRELRARAQEDNARATRFERELQELRAQVTRPQQQGESEAARAARQALMAPEEVMRENLRDAEQRTQATLNQLRLEQAESTDQLAFRQLLSDDPGLKRYEGEVNRLRAEYRANGQFVSREVVLDLVVGRAMRAQAKSKGPQARKQAQRQVAQHQTRPANTRGDTGANRPRGDDASARAKRLENVPL